MIEGQRDSEEGEVDKGGEGTQEESWNKGKVGDKNSI